MFSLFSRIGYNGLPEYLVFCLRWAEIYYFWNFEEWVNRANVFPVFPDWL